MFQRRKNKDLLYIYNNVPIFYKYTKVDSFEAIVQNSSLTFKNPTVFNDPYDCFPGLISFKVVPLNFRKYLIEKYKPLLDQEILTRIKNSTDNEIIKYFRDVAFPAEHSRLAITCFSEIPDNLLMWSHYADSHMGVCIGFDIKKLYFDIIMHQPAIIKVKYRDNLLKTEYFKSPMEAISNCFRIKAKCWNYEKEIRILLTNLTLDSSKITYIPIKKETINCIYLGSTINAENEEKVKSLCSSELPNVKIYKMELDNKFYKLVQR